MTRTDVRRPLQELLFEPSTAAVFFWTGGIVAGLVMLASGGWPHRSLVASLSMVALAVVIAVLRGTLGSRLAPWTLHADLTIATAIVSAILALAPPGYDYASIFYAWIGLFVALYFSRRGAAVQLALIAVAYAIVLRVGPPVRDAGLAWIVVLGTCVTFGFIVATLVNVLRTSSAQDPLTRIANRRSWEERLHDEMLRSRRSGEPLSIASFDVDHFKEVNDSLGHVAGDRLLRRFVDEWGSAVRGGGDFLARLGGDEFGLLAPGSDDREIESVAERLRAVTPDGVTCSIGVATWNGTESADDLFRRADQEMFKVKQQHRGS